MLYSRFFKIHFGGRTRRAYFGWVIRKLLKRRTEKWYRTQENILLHVFKRLYRL